MEFKISEKSQRNFEQLCKNIGAKEYISPTDLAEYEENERLLSEEKKKQRIKRKEKMGFSLIGIDFREINTNKNETIIYGK